MHIVYILQQSNYVLPKIDSNLYSKDTYRLSPIKNLKEDNDKSINLLNIKNKNKLSYKTN